MRRSNRKKVIFGTIPDCQCLLADSDSDFVAALVATQGLRDGGDGADGAGRDVRSPSRPANPRAPRSSTDPTQMKSARSARSARPCTSRGSSKRFCSQNTFRKLGKNFSRLRAKIVRYLVLGF